MNIFTNAKRMNEEANKFIAGLRRTQGNDPIWFGPTEPQTDMTRSLAHTAALDGDVRVKFALEVQRRFAA